MNYSIKSISNFINIIIYFLSILSVFIFTIDLKFIANYGSCLIYNIILITILFHLFESFQYYQKTKHMHLCLTYGKTFFWQIQMKQFFTISPLLAIIFIYLLFNNRIIMSLLYTFIVVLSVIQYINIIIVVLSLLSKINKLISSSFIFILNIPNFSLTGKILNSNIDYINQDILIFISLFFVMLINMFFIYNLIRKNKY